MGGAQRDPGCPAGEVFGTRGVQGGLQPHGPAVVADGPGQFQPGGGRGNAPANPRAGSLKVVTTKLKPGYLRRNGVPYSANATLTEYYDLVTEANGDTYLVLTSTVEDPMYLTQPMITAAHFKKQADAAGWNPAACAVR